MGAIHRTLPNTMKKSYLFAVVPLVLSIGCLVAFHVMGAHVAPDGTLVEPFGLVPMGFALFLVGMLAGLGIGVWSLFHNPSKTDQWMFGSFLAVSVLLGLYLVASMS